MQRLCAFKYELRPDGQQARQMRRFAGSCRFVFNKALALQKERYEQGEKKLGYVGLCKLLTEWRNSPDSAWLADAPGRNVRAKSGLNKSILDQGWFACEVSGAVMPLAAGTHRSDSGAARCRLSAVGIPGFQVGEDVKAILRGREAGIMANNLFIIEAPGKRKGMSNMLWRAGVRDVEVMATVGHIGTNPNGFKPLAVDSEYRETAYRLRPDKERLAAEIGKAAKAAKRIYIATDDDQEGDVIARDVLRFCLDKQDRSRALRVRLKALSPGEIQAALAAAAPFDELSAARGDARRIIDRLIGSMSNDIGAVGRVQGSMLLMLQEQHPVVGVMTYSLRAADGKGDWIAKVPVFAGQDITANSVVDGVAEAGRSEIATLAGRPMNHDEILLSASIATGQSIGSVARAMQSLYESGQMTYPRAKDYAITPDSFRRLQAISMRNGAGFDPSRFRAIRQPGGEHTHEAPNAMMLDVPVNRPFDLLSLEEQVLVHLTRNLIDCGIPCQFETPRLADLAALPAEFATLRWHRVIPIGQRLWEVMPVKHGFQAWTKEQSLLHFMIKNELGRPSTVVTHVEKFLSRDLVDESFELTSKGREWSARIGELFGHQNISKMIENYIDNNKKTPSEMVADMIEICGLNAVGSAFQQQGFIHNEDYKIPTGNLP